MRALVVATSSTLLLAACARFEPADPARLRLPEPELAPIEWPSRHVEPLLDLARSPPPQAFHMEHYLVGKLREAVPPDVHWDRFVRGMYGEGIVSEVVEEESNAGSVRRFGFVTNWHPPEALAAKRKDMRESEDSHRLLFNLMDFEIDIPEAAPARGLVFLISSWGGQEYELPVQDELIGRGWAVLTASPPAKSREPYAIEVRGRDDIPRAAERAAREIDNRIADAAYGIEAALEFLQDARPDLPPGPVFIIGFSAGAAPCPAIAARLGKRVAGLVLVGAGSNLLHAGLAGGFGGQPFRLSWPGGEPREEDLNDLTRRYLESSELDPYWTALRCRRTPALLLHAAWDRIVPAAGGEVLYERMGRPDRFVSPFGHAWLFWRFPGYREEIADWIERQAGIHASSSREV